MMEVYGLTRTRDAKGVIIKRTAAAYVMCLHANCGGGYETMQVLVLEVYEDSADR